MKTYVACIGEEAVLAFRAEEDDEARAMIDDQEGGIRSDLKALVGADGKPLWDGKSAIQAKEATAAEQENGSSLATKQSATRKLTWILATTPMSGASI